MAGCCLAALERGRQIQGKTEGGSANPLFLASVGLGLIALAAFWIDNKFLYPGYWAALPVVGTVMVIRAGPGTWINRCLLGNRVMVYLGLISYPLYLWHWPLLSFHRIIEGPHASVGTTIGLVILSVALSVGTYHLIEQKLRRSRSVAVTQGLVLTMLLISCVGLLGFLGTLQSRFSGSSFDIKIADATRDWEYPGKLTSVEMANRYIYRVGGASPQTVFWGDSHIEQYAPRIYDLLKSNTGHGRGAIFITPSSGGVPPLPGVLKSKNRDACNDNEAQFMSVIEDPRVDRVVIAASWNGYFEASSPYYFHATNDYPLHRDEGKNSAFSAFENLLRKLTAQGKTVYVIQDNPHGEQLAPTYIFRRGFLSGGFSLHDEGVSRTAFLENSLDIRTRLHDAAKRSGAILIDPLDHLRREDRFPSLSETAEPIYIDASHLRASFVKKYVRYLDQTVIDTP